MILYILAISYPFCALFVLIPDKATNFLIWFAAWTWAKSWDVGWAVVMVIENLLWEFMPLDAVTTPADSFDVVSMMDQSYSSNHTNALATYYVIVSMMLGAVPIVTARVLLGSKAAMGQHLVNGLQKVTNNVGEKLSRRKAITQLRGVTSQKSQGAREFIARGMSAALFGSFENGQLLDQNGDAIPIDSQLGQALKNLYSNTEFQAARSNIEQSLAVAAKGKGATEWGALATAFGSVAAGKVWQARMGQAMLAAGGVMPALAETNKSYNMLHRSAMNQQYKLAESVGKFMSYEYGFTEEFRYYEAMRAAISDRGEFFTFPDTPVSAQIDFSNLAVQSASSMVGGYGATLGGAAAVTEAAAASTAINKRRGG